MPFRTIQRCIITLLFIASIAHAQEKSFSVRRIDISGNQRIDEAAIRQQIEIVPGKVSQSEVREDIKRLYSTGFFEQVNANLQKESLLVFSLVEKPIVRKVFIRGNTEIKTDSLKDILRFEGTRFFDRSRVKKIIRDARSYYQLKGYYDTEFDYSVLPVGKNEIDVTFSVQEGPRYYIDSIDFRGLKNLDADELREVMETKEHKWWNSWLFGTGRLNRDMLENDRTLIRQYFLDNGYVDATISAPGIEKEEESLKIVFDIVEGDQYRVGTVKLSGDSLEEYTGEVLEELGTQSGEIFKASEIRKDSFTIGDLYSDEGYAFANVVPDTQIDRRAQTLDVTFDVDRGKPVTINRITIRGNDKTYDRVVRRELKIAERERYSGTAIKRSRVLLERLGFFEEVNISTEPTEKDDEVDLNVQVREGSTGSFSAGAGYSSTDRALINTRITENNLFGTGRSLTLNADFGSRRDNLILSFQDRRFLDTYWSMGVSGSKTEREFTDFDRNLMGGSLQFGYPLEELFHGEWAEDIQARIRYQYLDIEIDRVQPNAADLIRRAEGNSTSSSITPSIVRNTINNPLDPTSGSRQILSFEISGPGGNEEFFLVDARNRMYYPLFNTEAGEVVFSWRTRVSYGETYGDDDEFPLFRRFFPGGIHSIRGFKARTLGPKDANGSEFGGSKQLINNLELIFPLVSAAGLKGVIFYDVGEAFNDNQNIDFGELRHAYGAGLRWKSPLGPIRIEFGFPVDKEEGEDSMVTLFSFGAPL